MNLQNKSGKEVVAEYLGDKQEVSKIVGLSDKEIDEVDGNIKSYLKDVVHSYISLGKELEKMRMIFRYRARENNLYKGYMTFQEYVDKELKSSVQWAYLTIWMFKTDFKHGIAKASLIKRLPEEQQLEWTQRLDQENLSVRELAKEIEKIKPQEENIIQKTEESVLKDLKKLKEDLEYLNQNNWSKTNEVIVLWSEVKNLFENLKRN